jgi:hypothetical protein
MGFGLFMTAEFIEMAVIGFMLTTLFFGGYTLPPWLISNKSILAWDVTWDGWAWVFRGAQLAAFFVKMTILWLLQFVIRWALPRFRYDQLMRLGWRIMLPLSLVNIGVSAIALLLGGNGAGGTDYLMFVGLTIITLFCLSLFYSRQPRAAGGHDAHDAGHGDAHDHAHAAPAAAHH